MKLNLDFSQINRVRLRMGASLVNSFKSEVKGGTLKDFNNGTEVRPEELGIGSHGQILHQESNEVILLYIKDVNSLGHRPRFHVAGCGTIQGFMNGGNIDRYIGVKREKNTLQPDYFELEDSWGLRKNVKLLVCKNCLHKLDYRGYAKNFQNEYARNKIFSEFNLNQFFDEYRKYNPIFKELNQIHSLIKESARKTEDFLDDIEASRAIFKRIDSFKQTYKEKPINYRDKIFRDTSQFEPQNIDQIRTVQLLKSFFRERAELTDFSTLVVQYSRILEIEFQEKLIGPFIDYVRGNYSESDYDSTNNDTKLLFNKIKFNDKRLAFGQIHYILKCLNCQKEGALFSILTDYLPAEMYDSDFLKKLEEYKTEFRNNAAHTGTINAYEARRCELLFKSILKHLFRNLMSNKNK